MESADELRASDDERCNGAPGHKRTGHGCDKPQQVAPVLQRQLRPLQLGVHALLVDVGDDLTKFQPL